MAYAAGGAGFVLLWAALNNRSVLSTLQDLVQGRKPAPGPGGISNKIPGVGTPDPTIGSVGNMQDEAKIMLAKHGWQNQWDSFNKLEMGEAGYNPLAENKVTGFFGVAQAGNHGNAHTAAINRVHQYGLHKGQPINNYGGFGLSNAEAQSANAGDGVLQLQWMGNYIAAQYGDPNHAYMKWLSRNPHWY
jgi:hypothetical protein